jgi:hypothetical protein
MKRKHRHKGPFPDEVVRTVGLALHAHARDYPLPPVRPPMAGWQPAQVAQFSELTKLVQVRGRKIIDEMNKREMREYCAALKPFIDDKSASRVQQIEFLAAFGALTWDHFEIVREELGDNVVGHRPEARGILDVGVLLEMLGTRGGIRVLNRMLKEVEGL